MSTQNDLNRDESVDKWFSMNQIWEPVIPGVKGAVVIDNYKPAREKVICKQLFKQGTADEHLGENFIEFDKESFMVSFKPTKKQYASPCDEVNDTDGSTNYLKMDGDKAQFESGAIRYTKTGKGRYDLIPGDVIADIISHANDMFEEKAIRIVSKADVVEDAYRGDPEDRFVRTIINVIIDHYAPSDIVENDMGLTANEVTFTSFTNGFSHMLKDLAIHYENGAEKYGVDNWKKGIPVTGGDRGGSFMDSAMRHLTQYLIGLTDEPHYISCIWNCVCGLWTLYHQHQIPSDK